MLADDSGIGNDADLFEEPLGALASLRIDAEFVAEVGREDGRSSIPAAFVRSTRSPGSARQSGRTDRSSPSPSGK